MKSCLSLEQKKIWKILACPSTSLELNITTPFYELLAPTSRCLLSGQLKEITYIWLHVLVHQQKNKRVFASVFIAGLCTVQQAIQFLCLLNWTFFFWVLSELMPINEKWATDFIQLCQEIKISIYICTQAKPGTN